jgi:4-alpha-glucanotransferase
MVIAEDLGTIGDNVREALVRFRMLSYRLLYFERNYPERSFAPPGRYPDRALCAVTTHDLPTLYGYWEGKDLKIRRQIGSFRDDEVWKTAVQEREQDKSFLLRALAAEGLLHDGYASDASPVPDMSPDLCRAVYEYLARTPSRIVLVSLDDITGMVDQQNLPGTTDSYPNWLRKISVTLEEVLSQGMIRALSEIFAKNRRVKEK